MLRSDVARCVSPRAHINTHLIVAPPDKALYQSSEHLMFTSESAVCLLIRIV